MKANSNSYLEGNKNVDLKAYIRFRDLFYTGIAMSDKGFSLIRGLETNNKTKLVQIYIKQDNIEKDYYNIVGIKDTIANKFEGEVKNSKFENDPKIVCPAGSQGMISFPRPSRPLLPS